MMEMESRGNDGRQAKSQLQSWTGPEEPEMQRASMYATGANPTLVQNDEHVLVEGHRPGRGTKRGCEWGKGCATVPDCAL